jgi:hypothetical protein
LCRTGDLYVTNKKGGDNVKAALLDVIRRDHRLAGIEDIPGVRTALITGAIDAGLINAIVTEAGQRPAVGSPFRPEALRDPLRGVIATSAISHGVDVDEFNVMFLHQELEPRAQTLKRLRWPSQICCSFAHERGELSAGGCIYVKREKLLTFNFRYNRSEAGCKLPVLGNSP